MHIPERMIPIDKIYAFCRQIRGIQVRWKAQLMYQKARLDVLHEHYRLELDEYRLELLKAKDKEGKALAKQYASNYNAGFADRLLLLYMKRCTTKHALAFL